VQQRVVPTVTAISVNESAYNYRDDLEDSDDSDSNDDDDLTPMREEDMSTMIKEELKAQEEEANSLIEESMGESPFNYSAGSKEDKTKAHTS